ncbi:MAG: hypothetical protein RSD13_03715 [Clostridium sp.]|uniref:hypothetical protein n=1 Tax=Clostridium sp. TaxID=1506 RepID=UPI002FCB5351
MKEDVIGLLNEYKETEKCLNMGLEWLPENDFARAKLEVIRVIIEDLEALSNKVIN